jgi:hypothetical protein
MTNRLEDVDLALEVLEELGGELLARDGLDRHWLAGALLGGGKGGNGVEQVGGARVDPGVGS